MRPEPWRNPSGKWTHWQVVQPRVLLGWDAKTSSQLSILKEHWEGPPVVPFFTVSLLGEDSPTIIDHRSKKRYTSPLEDLVGKCPETSDPCGPNESDEGGRCQPSHRRRKKILCSLCHVALNTATTSSRCRRGSRARIHDSTRKKRDLGTWIEASCRKFHRTLAKYSPKARIFSAEFLAAGFLDTGFPDPAVSACLA